MTITSSWPGLFISFEGVDGAGKSTQVAALGAALRSDGQDVISVREPGDTALGELMRAFLLQHQLAAPITPWAEALLFVGARAQLLQETVLPALERGAVVIADRYADSTLAYQGGGRGLDREALLRLHRDACGDVWPDLTILLDLPLQVAESRRRAAELPFDRFDRGPYDFFSSVHAAFRAIAERSPDRVAVVDASPSPVAVSQEVWRAVADRLDLAGVAPPASLSRRD